MGSGVPRCMTPIAPLRRTDPRLYQIASLALLLAYGIAALSFDVTPGRALLLLSAALGSQALFTRLFRLPAWDPWSSLISGLSLCLLLRTASPLLAVLAAVHAAGRVPPGPYAPAPASGITAVASISTRARSSMSAATCTAVIAGKCRPMTSR